METDDSRKKITRRGRPTPASGAAMAQNLCDWGRAAPVQKRGYRLHDRWKWSADWSIWLSTCESQAATARDVHWAKRRPHSPTGRRATAVGTRS